MNQPWGEDLKFLKKYGYLRLVVIKYSKSYKYPNQSKITQSGIEKKNDVTYPFAADCLHGSEEQLELLDCDAVAR